MNWTSLNDGFANLFDQGGLILWAIVASSVYMWLLLFERYWFHWKELPALRNRLRDEFYGNERGANRRIVHRRIKALVDDLRVETARNLMPLQALVAILPLLGLLGTVSGMIKVFEVITVFGTGNTRGMASGISEALVTTMAGLFTALSGLYFVSDLERRVAEVARRFESELVEDQ